MTDAAAATAAPVTTEKTGDATAGSQTTATATATAASSGTTVLDPAAKAAAAQASADPATATPAWPQDWQKLAAGGDDKKMQRISRYASPQALAEALIESQDKIRSAGLKVAAPKDNPEALKTWRAENGIPDAPDKYEIKLSNDLIVGDADKPYLNDFLKTAHEANLPPDAVNKMADWYFQKQETQIMEVAKQDDGQLREAKKALMQEWGGGYEGNLDEVANHLVGQYGQEMASQLHLARLPDGRLLGNVPEFTRALLKQARDQNPGAVLVPGASNQTAAVGDRIKQIKDIMVNDPNKYWKDPNMQEEFAKLLQFEEKAKQRG